MIANYEQDFRQWLLGHQTALRQDQITELDIFYLTEELEGMAKRHKWELASRLVALLMHLLKWQYQPGRQSRSWRLTSHEQRRMLHKLLHNSPSLRAELTAQFAETYQEAREKASAETGLAEAVFPRTPPYTADQTLDPDFWPVGLS